MAKWRLDADDPVAPLRRQCRGSITPEIQWRHYAGDLVAPLRRQWNGSYMPKIHSVLAAAVKQAGRSPQLRYNDLLAAQAIEHGYALLTLNTNDFAGLPGLRLATLSTRAKV